ncbi:MAG: hypothetical protein ABI175_07915, partial [Polyangiales bacterium]
MRSTLASQFLLALLVALILGCTDLPALPERPGVQNPADVLSVSTTPLRDDGRTPSVVRLAIELGHTFPADAARAGRILLVTGGADPAEVAAIVHNHTTTALRARYATVVAWGEPAAAPMRLVVQPTAPLPAGRATLVLLIDKMPPFVLDLDVAAVDARARRVWPLAGEKASALEPWTYCARDEEALGEALVDAPDVVVLAPSSVTARVVRRDESPCLDLVPEGPLSGQVVPPPALGALALDPEPVTIDAVEDRPLDARCDDEDLSLGPLCAHVDDDRVVFIGSETASLLVLGDVAGRTITEAVAPHGRATVRGLPPSSALELAVVVRGHAGQWTHRVRFRTAASHRHLVLNEVLAHPPSGSPLQRFVEVVNDGDRPASLVGSWLADGATFYELPTQTLAPGELVLITPDGFIDGLGGDVPPSKTIAR